MKFWADRHCMEDRSNGIKLTANATLDTTMNHTDIVFFGGDIDIDLNGTVNAGNAEIEIIEVCSYDNSVAVGGLNNSASWMSNIF